MLALEMSWEVLVNLESLKMPVRLRDRFDLDRSWLTDPNGLNIRNESIYSFPDLQRYHWKIFDDAKDIRELGNYGFRLDIDQLNGPEFADYDLLEFNSLFGSSRLALTMDEHHGALEIAEDAMVFKFPKLDRIADAIESMIGGRRNYIGLHCRVGDGGFKVCCLWPHVRRPTDPPPPVFSRASYARHLQGPVPKCARAFRRDLRSIDYGEHSAVSAATRRRAGPGLFRPVVGILGSR